MSKTILSVPPNSTIFKYPLLGPNYDSWPTLTLQNPGDGGNGQEYEHGKISTATEIKCEFFYIEIFAFLIQLFVQ